MDSNRHRSTRRPPNPGNTRSEFQAASRRSLRDTLPSPTPTWGENIGSINMSQPQNMVNAPVGGGTVVNVTVNSEDAPTSSNTRHEHLHDPTSIAHADHEIYCSQLLTKKRGHPLWRPGPALHLPIEYRRQGISIGDVGMIRSIGGFDFLFNIFQPANHPTNRRMVPQGFSPLSFQEFASDIEIITDYGPGTYLAGSSVRKMDIGSSVDQRFESTAKEAAILIMPDGATTQDLLNTQGIRSTISSHAKDWYAYARLTRGREVRNGDIRVVVGVDKVESWGIATSSCTTGQTSSYVFKHDPIHTYKWDCIGGSGRVGPQRMEIRDLIEGDAAPQNQSVFIRTINFTHSGKTWNNPSSEAVQQQSGPRSGKFGRRGSAPGRRQSSRGGDGNSGRGHASSAGSMQETSHCMSLSVNFEPVELYVNHPSTTLHNYLHEKFPDADMVITEDMDWISVLNDDDTVFPELDDLCERMLKAHAVLNDGGIIQLLRNNDTRLRQSGSTNQGKVKYAERVAVTSQPHGSIFDDVPPINPPPNPPFGFAQALRPYSGKSFPSTEEQIAFSVDTPQTTTMASAYDHYPFLTPLSDDFDGGEQPDQQRDRQRSALFSRLKGLKSRPPPYSQTKSTNQRSDQNIYDQGPHYSTTEPSRFEGPRSPPSGNVGPMQTVMATELDSPIFDTAGNELFFLTRE